MAEVTVYDATRMKAIEDATVVNGEIDPVTGHLELTRFDASVIDAGAVNLSPRIVTSSTRPTPPDVFDGLEIYELDTREGYVYYGTDWIPLGRGTVICTSSTRPTGIALEEGLKIYETDTNFERTYDGADWRISGPAYIFGHEHNVCTAIGGNDYAGTGWTNVDLNKTMVVPTGDAKNLHVMLNLSFRGLTGIQTWDVRLKYNGSVVPNSTYNVTTVDSGQTPIFWSFVIACGGLTNPALQVEAQRTAGGSSHRQNASHYSLMWWYD